MAPDNDGGSRRRLKETDHPRDAAGLRYVYPVVSRRSGGVSVGLNLNPNQACNWRCIYCQVPGLHRGMAPPVDLDRLESELEGFLRDILHGDFFQRQVPEGARVLRDIALSGDGESTTAREFPAVVERLAAVRDRLGIGPEVKSVLITNGSQVHRAAVQEGLRRLASISGEVWFKIDRATPEGRRQVNDTGLSTGRVRANAVRAASLCPTWIQTCWFALDGEAPSEKETAAYVDLVGSIHREAPLLGVLLYGIARPSHQPEAPRLSRLPRTAFDPVAKLLREHGLEVRITP